MNRSSCKVTILYFFAFYYYFFSFFFLFSLLSYIYIFNCLMPKFFSFDVKTGFYVNERYIIVSITTRDLEIYGQIYNVKVHRRVSEQTGFWPAGGFSHVSMTTALKQKNTGANYKFKRLPLCLFMFISLFSCRLHCFTVLQSHRLNFFHQLYTHIIYTCVLYFYSTLKNLIYPYTIINNYII